VTYATASFPVLGTEGFISGPAGFLPAEVLERIRVRWAELEGWFSLARPESELTLVAAGRKAVLDTHPEVRAAYLDAIRWRTLTRGAYPTHRADGALDLTGLARAYALRDAAAELTDAGVESWLAGVGTDLVSDALGGAGWVADLPGRGEGSGPLASVPLGGSWTALATSQAEVRGTVEEFVQASVLGRDIVCVDVLATAVVAGGSISFELAAERWPVDVVAVRGSGKVGSTPRLARHLRHAVDAPV
jgi:FAD:protein FMN transferase